MPRFTPGSCSQQTDIKVRNVAEGELKGTAVRWFQAQRSDPWLNLENHRKAAGGGGLKTTRRFRQTLGAGLGMLL